MTTRFALAALLVCALAAPASAGTLSVVTTTEDLASLAREVGGERVKVDSLSRGYQDPHFVEAKPSFILKLHSADLLVAVGKELELAWLPPLQRQSRNANIQVGARGYLDASETVEILEIPTGPVTRAMGDVHPQGNPHYWLDPANGRRMAQAIAARLAELAPADKATFESRLSDFDRRLAAAEKRWDATMAPFRGTELVTYHRSWPNFCARFGLDVIGYVEPRPGIPPSPAHTLALMAEMKQKGVKAILVEPYFDLKTPDSVARETGARVVVMAPSVGGEKGVDDYIALFDHLVTQVADALGGGR